MLRNFCEWNDTMDKRTKGAWLVHHTQKLSAINGIYDFEDIELAGKCGKFLSNLAASDEPSDLNVEKVNVIAQVSNIKKTEIDTIKTKLKEAQLIDTSQDGSITVLGITTSTVLSHTADIFSNCNPTNIQSAALELSEKVSDIPKKESALKEYLSDTYYLSKSESTTLFSRAETIGFVDSEDTDDKCKFFFNGNLFRRENQKKMQIILSSLQSDDTQKIIDLDQRLQDQGCFLQENAKQILGEQLLNKLQSIGMYDFNEVSNSEQRLIFITKPSSFSKYGSPFEEDALDLAKAFVSSLYYGMHFSRQNRGKIFMLERLLRKLVDGHEVGPATAIGEDYKLLEMRRVIQLRTDPNHHSRYFMRLLKKDIGILAMEVLRFDDTAESSLDLYPGNVVNYVGPEQNRYTANRCKLYLIC